MAKSAGALRAQTACLSKGPKGLSGQEHQRAFRAKGPKGFKCAGWAQNPKGPQITPFRHQMGHRGTIWDFKSGIRLRIPARISPWGSRGDMVFFGQ